MTDTQKLLQVVIMALVCPLLLPLATEEWELERLELDFADIKAGDLLDG